MKFRLPMLMVLVVMPLYSVSTLATELPSGSENLRPYIQVKPVEGEQGIVRGFFSPSCRFSRQYLHFFGNLANTLPANRKFVYTPVVNKLDGVAYAMSFYAVELYYPAYVPNYIAASMQGVQDLGLAVQKWGVIDRIGQAAHVPVPVSRLVNAHLPQIEKEVQRTITLQSKLSITNTPTIAVDGTYIITPEFTRGDPELFSKLTNAVISMSE